MDRKIRKILWEIIKKYQGPDIVHGVPHIQRVFENFKILRKDSSINEEILDALEYSVLLHDLGRNAGNDKNHAVNSALILDKLFTNELSGVPNKGWVRYAVANHSIGIQHKIRNKQDICLALLVLLDHMDTLGGIGIYRLVRHWGHRIPLAPENDEKRERALFLLDHPEEVTREMMPMRARSMLENLIYFYAATEHISYPVKSLIGREIKREINSRLYLMKHYILNLAQSLK